MRASYLNNSCGGYFNITTAKWAPELLSKRLFLLNDDNCCVVGDCTLRDQFGAHTCCLATKSECNTILESFGLVDWDLRYMSIVRTGASYVLEMLCILNHIHQFVTNPNTSINIHTDCLTLKNYCSYNTVNTPSYVLVYHINIIDQICHMIHNLKLIVNLIFTN